MIKIIVSKVAVTQRFWFFLFCHTTINPKNKQNYQTPRSSFPKSSQDSGLAPPPPPPPRVSLLSQLILGVRPVILRVNPNCAVFWWVHVHVCKPRHCEHVCKLSVRHFVTTVEHPKFGIAVVGLITPLVGSRVGERTLIFSSPPFVMLKKTSRKKSAQIKCIHVSRVRGDQGTCRGFNRFIIIFSKIHRVYWVNVGTFELK